MQDKIYSGNFGLGPSKDLTELDYILNKSGCRLEESKCEEIVENYEICK